MHTNLPATIAVRRSLSVLGESQPRHHQRSSSSLNTVEDLFEKNHGAHLLQVNSGYLYNNDDDFPYKCSMPIGMGWSSKSRALGLIPVCSASSLTRASNPLEVPVVDATHSCSSFMSYDWLSAIKQTRQSRSSKRKNQVSDHRGVLLNRYST